MTWTQAWRTEDLGTGSTNTKPQADEDHRQAFVRFAKVGISPNLILESLILTEFK